MQEIGAETEAVVKRLMKKVGHGRPPSTLCRSLKRDRSQTIHRMAMAQIIRTLEGKVESLGF